MVAQLVGSVPDEHGCERPADLLAYRVGGNTLCKDLHPAFSLQWEVGKLLFHNPGSMQCIQHSKTQ